MTDVAMTVRRPGPRVAVIDVVGDVTGESQAACESAYAEVGPSVRAIVLNISGLSDHYREIVALTRLDEAIAIVDDEDAAVSTGAA